MRTRAEHIQWCKDRALEYARAGDLDNAINSMGSDLARHPETRADANGALMRSGMLYLIDGDHEAIRRWIERFR